MPTPRTMTRTRSMIGNLGLLILGLYGALSNTVGRVAAQSVSINDLPSCARPCATKAASDVNCLLGDTVCLCSRESFKNSTVLCSRNVCRIEDWGITDAVLLELCESVTTVPVSNPSTFSTHTGSSSQTSTSSLTATATPSASASLSSSLSTPSSSISESSSVSVSVSVSVTTEQQTLTPSLSLSTSTSGSGSSTIIVVQTIVVPPGQSGVSNGGGVSGSGSGGGTSAAVRTTTAEATLGMLAFGLGGVLTGLWAAL